MNTRTTNSAKNLIVGGGGQFLNLILEFFARTVFIYTLPTEFLGISGLFSNILSVLSLTELGIGSAIVCALYRPLADKDHKKVLALMNFYKKSYRWIGMIILGLGFTLVPFLPYIMKDSTNLVDTKVFYLLYLLQSVSSYWFFAYKSSLLTADQKNYVISFWQYLVYLLKTLVRIIFLLALKDTPLFSFYVFTVIGIAFNIISNMVVAIKVNRIYPFMRQPNKETLEPREKKRIFKNVAALCLNKISAVVNESTDNIIISAFVGIVSVGLYSNYLLIITSVNGLIRILSSSIGASIGNLNAVESRDKKEEFFKILHFLYFWIYGFCAICLWRLLNPFIGGIWVGEEYLLSPITVFIIVLDFLINGLMSAPQKYQSESGLFWEFRYIPLISVAMNVSLSLFFSAKLNWDIGGIILATIISRVLVMLPTYPFIVYKYIFSKKPWEYFRMYAGSFTVILITGLLTQMISLPFKEYTKTNFLFNLIICILLPNFVWYLMYRNTKEFTYLKKSTLVILRNITEKRRI